MAPNDSHPAALTAGQQETIDRILAEFRNDSTQLLGILLAVQAAEEGKYISQPAAVYVARKLELKITQVYDVISFYTAIHDAPQAKYPLEVCDSAPCRVNDNAALLAALEEALGIRAGETTPDGRFSIHKVPCFGACDVAPAVRVNGTVYGNLTGKEQVQAMLAQLA